MSIKILHRGKTPEEKVYILNCSKCETKFTYQQADIKYELRGDDYVPCPVCKQFLTPSKIEYNEPTKQGTIGELVDNS